MITRLRIIAFGVLVVAHLGRTTEAAASEEILEDWKRWPSTLATSNPPNTYRINNGWLEVQVQQAAAQIGVVLQPRFGVWNLNAFAEVAVPIRSLGSNAMRVILRVDDHSTTKLLVEKSRGGTFEAFLNPALEPTWLVVPLGDAKASPLADKFVSMTGKPVDFVRRGNILGAEVKSVSIFILDAQPGQALAIGPVVARGIPAPLREWSEARAFPFVDDYGQFLFRDWPGKIQADGDFARRRQVEESDLMKNQRPADWSRFGGWANGPKLAATGYFRTEKYNGAWWLVDPEGCLFWSHGVARVGTRIRVGSIYHGTPLLGRESYARLPAKDSPFGSFYDKEPQSTWGYYLGKDDHAVYDILEANLYRKYGTNWASDYAVQAQRRLASWGLNTIANSSDPAICAQRKTPYTAIVYSAPLGRSEFRIQGSGGHWGKLPDPFDPGWRQLMNRTLQTELKEALMDPWCIGFFVDNELKWGTPDNPTCHLAEVTLASPAQQPAKIRMVTWLKTKYPTIQALNLAWTTAHGSWDDLLAATSPPDRKRPEVRADLEGFSEQVLDAYFRGCREALKSAAPNHLYLGCRFADQMNALAIRVAGRYCDIVSINRYARHIADLALPEGVDRPILIGEFHFAAMDSPMYPSGLVLVANQTDRGRAYSSYVRSALENPAVIGTHWFQLYDQPATGRFDGENYQIGLLDIADSPYQEMIDACREVGRTLYDVRASSAVKPLINHTRKASGL